MSAQNPISTSTRELLGQSDKSSSEDKIEADGSARAFREALGLAKAAVCAAGMSNSRLAVDEFGMIFFAPIETGVDGFVCQVTDSDILLICRDDLAANSSAQPQFSVLRRGPLPNTSTEGERNKLLL
jgi:hypothetical protein